MISIKKCLEVMHSGAVFSLRVVAYDKRRKDKRGQVRQIDQAVLVWGDGGKDRTARKGERPMTALEKSLLTSPTPETPQKRDPGHAMHYTRNIRVLVDGVPTESIVKIHPPLIIQFNGQTTTP